MSKTCHAGVLYTFEPFDRVEIVAAQVEIAIELNVMSPTYLMWND